MIIAGSAATDKAAPRRLRWVRGWSLWSLPRSAASVILAIDLIAVVLTGLACAVGRAPSLGEWARCSLLLMLAVGYAEATARVELLRRYMSVEHGPMSNMLSVWTVPAALVLQPRLVVLFTLVIAAHALSWKARTGSLRVHRAVFGDATTMLAALTASAISGATGARDAFWSFSWSVPAAIGVLAAALAFTLVNAGLLVVGMYAALRPVRFRSLLLSRDDFALEYATLILGLFVAVALAKSPWLVPAIAGVVLVLQRSAMVAKLKEAASQDGKTGLLNAATWDQRAATELHRAERERTGAAVLLVDLDHFKRVNDTHGHLAGDEALRAVAAALTSELRGHDIVARYGGEEFAVLLPGATPRAAAAVAERIRHGIATADTPFAITASIGVAHYPEHGATVAELFAVADAALYVAKDAGRDRVSVGAP